MGLGERFRRFMYGRYGVDTLNRWITYLVLALMILQLFIRSFVLSFLELVLVVVCILRIFSKDIARRSQENNRFCAFKAKISGRLRREKNLMNQRKQFHIYTCPRCKQKIRIPKGKGRIEVSCPKCGEKFIKRS